MRQRRQELQEHDQERDMGHETSAYLEGRQEVAAAQGAQGRRPCVPRALPALHAVRVVPSGRVPPLHRDRLAPQPRRDSVRLYLRGHRAASVGRFRQVPLPAVERDSPQGPRERERRACRHRYADVQRRAVDAVRSRDRLRQQGARPGTRTAGTLPGRHRQTGRRRPRHHLRYDEGQSAARGREGFGADVVIDVQTQDIQEEIRKATGGKGVDVSVDCTAAPVRSRCTPGSRRSSRRPESS